MTVSSSAASCIWRIVGPLNLWHRYAALRRGVGVVRDGIELSIRGPDRALVFFVVSCERNAGECAVKCLDSVYRQQGDRGKVRHLYIDDASTDNTDELIHAWLSEHPDHNVEYVRHESRQGATVNTVEAFRKAPAGSIVIELNGDDWLPDPGVVRYLRRVYANPSTWMTYNTMKRSDGAIYRRATPIPPQMVRDNSYRDHEHWITHALQTFRKELFDHVREETLIDPLTGEYWESADDQAIYLAMLEMAGTHAKHINRIMYIYNYRESSHMVTDADATMERVRRIKAMPRCERLAKL